MVRSDDACQCGRPSDEISSMRIVGGRRAEPHSFPWTISFVKEGRQHCGGALVTDRHVLSAGHCFKWDDKDKMVALIGLDSLSERTNVEERYLSKVIIHENFKSTAVRDENDIAVATFDRPVAFNSIVRPICLPESGQNFDGRVGTIVGWGRLAVNGPSSDVLMKASLRILSDEECMNSELAKHIEPTMMCAFSNGKDGCQGDSGGPLLVFEGVGKYVLAGIVSWGIGCADPRYPGVYTKVTRYLDWIKEHTADGQTCDYR